MTTIAFWDGYEALNGILFDDHPTAGGGDHSLKPLADLRDELAKLGITAVVLDETTEADYYLFLDPPNLDTPAVRRAFETGKPRILWQIETPTVRPDLWNPALHARYRRVMTWAPELCRFGKYRFSPLMVNVPDTFTLNHGGKLACMVNSAKRIIPTDEAFAGNELYTFRLNTVMWFDQTHPADFDLWGRGWGNTNFGELSVYRGETESKILTMSNYRFAIVTENCRLNGWVTEKLFDAWRAGCIPVYLGAPDITTYVHPGTFVDASRFKSFEEMYDYISNMTPGEIEMYASRINIYLRDMQSENFRPWRAAERIRRLINEITYMDERERPSITVTIPAYNYGMYIQKCVRSVLDQEGEFALNVVVLDNASTDNTYNQLKPFLEEPRFTYVRWNVNRGGAYNWNMALQADTKYLAILPADDAYLPGHLAEMIAALEARPECDLAYCPLTVINAEDVEMGVFGGPGLSSHTYAGGRDEFVDQLRFDNYASTTAIVYRRSAVEAIGGFDVSFEGAGDYDFHLRLAKRNPNFVYVAHSTVQYRTHDKSHTARLIHTIKPLEDHLLILERHTVNRDRLGGKEADILSWLDKRIAMYKPEVIAHLAPRIEALKGRLS